MTPSTIGDLYPELANKFGLDGFQKEMLSEEIERWQGRVFPVTFAAPARREDGKHDPIAYLPPNYERFGVVDRRHRHRISIGETWIAEVSETDRGSLFLIPLFRLDVKSFLDLQPERLDEIASHLASESQELARELAKHLPSPTNPDLEGKIEEAEARVKELGTEIEELTKQRAALETRLGQLEVPQRPTGSPAPHDSIDPSQQADSSVGSEGPSPAASILAPYPGHEEILHRVKGDIVESSALIHSAYDVHFTGDLYRVILRPDEAGVPSTEGRVVIQGLSRVDPNPGPRAYTMRWDPRLGGFIVYLAQFPVPPKMEED